MSKRQQIGLFGGSFDPIHLGHFNIALQLKDLAHLSKIIFIPAALSPFKVDNPPQATGKQRFEMCQLAVGEYKGCVVSDIELKRGGVSYMVDTVKELVKQYSECDFRLILTEDALPKLHLWKDAETLVRLAPPLVGSRHKAKGLDLKAHFSPTAAQLIESGRMKTKVSPISSTEIRGRLAQDEDVSDMVPEKVIDYIKHNKLYSRRNYEERSPGNPQSGCANHL